MDNDSTAAIGYLVALSNRWPEPEQSYWRRYADSETNDFGLGALQLVSVDDGLWVATMAGRMGFDDRAGVTQSGTTQSSRPSRKWPTKLSDAKRRCPCSASAAASPVDLGIGSSRFSNRCQLRTGSQRHSAAS